MKSRKGISFFEVIAGFFVICAILAMLGPGLIDGIGPARKAQAKNDVVQIATAIAAFQTEYDRLPPIPSDGSVSGDLVTALVGSNRAANPRNIVFMEVGVAKKNSRSGLLSGAFVDPWGAPYEVAIATGTNDRVLAGTNHIEVLKKIAVWNNPALAPGGAKLKEGVKKRRYVTSWD